MEYLQFDRLLSVQSELLLVYKNAFYEKKCPAHWLLDYQSTHVCLQLDFPFFACIAQKKNQNLFAMNQCNKKRVYADCLNDCIDDILFYVTCKRRVM